MYFNLIWWPSDNLIVLDFILFQDCAFNKLLSDTALRVSFQGVMRVKNTRYK